MKDPTFVYLVADVADSAAIRLGAQPIVPVTKDGLAVMIAERTDHTLDEYRKVFSDPAEALAEWLGSVADKLVLIDGVAEQVNP